MMKKIVFNEMIEFHQPVYRNIQYASFDEFDDLSKDSKTRQYAHKKSSFQEYSFLNEYQYDAIDFIFLKESWLPTRFGNGTYPVWYGSIECETSFYETIFHWYKTFIESPSGFNSLTNNFIKSTRRIFTVECHAALIDLRNQAEKNSPLCDPHFNAYQFTQPIGNRIHQEGYPGLITFSARKENGENIAIFKKSILSKPAHFGDYVYEYDLDSKKMSVMDQLNKPILEIKGLIN